MEKASGSKDEPELQVLQETNEVRLGEKKPPKAAGLSRIMLAGLKTRHYIGRQAPVKRCLARFAGFAPCGVAYVRVAATESVAADRKSLRSKKQT